ncbi:MAG: HAD family hydrolase, partial [Gemmataceae bacterium]|nr:HAD family hydrolase [Gemmataceae bacterium]
MGTPYLIVWDLDNTVGEFDELQRADGNPEGVWVLVRPGLAEALALLTREGFTHSLLTLASPRYAELALRGTGLRDSFARVEGFGQRGKGDAE